MITLNLRYTGKDGAARKFAEEMTTSGKPCDPVQAEPRGFMKFHAKDKEVVFILLKEWLNL